MLGAYVRNNDPKYDPKLQWHWWIILSATSTLCDWLIVTIKDNELLIEIIFLKNEHKHWSLLFITFVSENQSQNVLIFRYCTYRQQILLLQQAALTKGKIYNNTRCTIANNVVYNKNNLSCHFHITLVFASRGNTAKRRWNNYVPLPCSCKVDKLFFT